MGGRPPVDFIDWINRNTTKPKWKWNKKFPKRNGMRIGVYLQGEDAIAVKLKFRLL
jgi:hypothetical protein